MSIFEYDEEREMKLIRRDERELGREQGLREGMEQGMEQGREEGFKQSINCFIGYNLEEQIPVESIIEKLQKIFSVLPEEGRQLISLYREAE